MCRLAEQHTACFAANGTAGATPAHHVSAQEHLILVTELLRANLYEFQRYIRNAGEPEYFTLPRVQSIASQVPAGRAGHTVFHCSAP